MDRYGAMKVDTIKTICEWNQSSLDEDRYESKNTDMIQQGKTQAREKTWYDLAVCESIHIWYDSTVCMFQETVNRFKILWNDSFDVREQYSFFKRLWINSEFYETIHLKSESNIHFSRACE